MSKELLKQAEEGMLMWQNAAVDLNQKLEVLQKERESLRDTLREVQLRMLKCEKSNLYTTSLDIIKLISEILEGHLIGEYILREECEAKVKATEDAADAFVAQQMRIK